MRRVNGDPSEALHVIERFTRVSADLIDYPLHGRGSADVDETLERRASHDKD